MSRKLDTVSRFSPGNCAPELLESMLVSRGQLADRLEKSVLDSVETGAGHHWLLIGPRGAGKTHLLAVLYNRIDLNPEIRSRVVVAYMKEEERGVASFLDWIVRILRALHRRHEEPPADEDVDLGQGLQNLKELPLGQAQSAAERLLLRFVGNRQLLLITENLGEIFDNTKGMGREGQQKFRDLVQQHPFWTVVASSQALFEDIQTRQAPFYGFFKVHHLRMFDCDEAVTLLKNLASLEGRTELRDFFDTELGRGRIRAIHQLTGGNPRLLVVFYQFIDRDSISDLASPFLEMVDDLTSYYQEQMQPLPALQQKIVEFLCERRSTATVKEIAQSCFITHQTASKQLSRLAKRHYVVATTVGRESFYELREPLFRICFEIKENLGYPIRLFIDFLGTFYSMEELKRKYRSSRLLRSIYERGGIEAQTRKVEVELGYLGEALSVYHSAKLDDIELEISPLCTPERETIGKTVEELFSERDYGEAVKLAEAAYELNLGDSEFLLKSAKGRRMMGDLPGAHERAKQLVLSDPESLDAWLEKVEIEKSTGDWDAAEESYQRILSLDGSKEDALVWLSRGSFLWSLGKRGMALECFEQAAGLRPDYAGVWQLLGVAQMASGNWDSAATSLMKATDLDPTQLVTWAVRSLVAAVQEKWAASKEYLQKAEVLGTEIASELEALGATYQALGIFDAAIQHYRRALELEPGNCNASFNIALAFFQAGDLNAGMKQMETAARAGTDQNWSRSMPLCITKIDERLLRDMELDRLPELLARQLLIFDDAPLRAHFIQGLTGALMELLKKHHIIPVQRLFAIRDRVIPELASTEELSVACRLFAAGVSYLETKDPRVLLKLPREERQSLEELLKSAS